MAIAPVRNRPFVIKPPVPNAPVPNPPAPPPPAPSTPDDLLDVGSAAPPVPSSTTPKTTPAPTSPTTAATGTTQQADSLPVESATSLNAVGLAEAEPAEPPDPNDVPVGLDIKKTPEEVQSIMTYIQGVVKDRGADILDYAVAKAKPDMSFQDPKNITKVALDFLKPEQRVAYYMNLQRGSSINKFLGDQYGDNLHGVNLSDGRVAAVNDPNVYADAVVQKDIDGRIRKVEKLMKTGGDAALLINSEVGNWIKENDPIGYGAIQSTFDLALFGFQGKAGTGADKYMAQSFPDALSGLATTTALAQSYLAKDDFALKEADLEKTYNEVFHRQLEKAAPGLTDITLRTRGEEGPPPADAPIEEYKAWYDSLTPGSASRMVEPIVKEAFDQSAIAAKLKEAGFYEGTDPWNQYKDTFARDVTMQYNSYWSSIRKGVKLDVIYSQVPDNGRYRTMFTKMPVVPGVDAEMFRAGAFHTVQNATLSAALAGTMIAAEGGASDPKTAMTLTYAATNLADMLAETASKYLDPKGGGFQKIGLNKNGSWTQSIAKYLPGGDFKAIEAAGKMMAGAGSVVFGATALWKTVDAIKAGETPAAVFNALNAAGSTISGLTLGAEGVLQWTNIAKNMAVHRFGMSSVGAAAFDAAARGVLASVGWAAGLVAGLGLTALGIYDMAKGVKVLEKSLKAANDEFIAPTTGWNYEFVFGPKP